MIETAFAKDYGDGTRWIKVFADGTGDFTTLTAAFAVHSETGARFLIKGALTEPASEDTSWITGTPETAADARILAPSAGQHLHFVNGASITLGDWRLLAFRQNDISIRCEAPLTIDVGQSPSTAGVSILVGQASGLDFAGCQFNVTATRPILLHAQNSQFIRFASLDNSALGKWIFSHSRSVTHDLGGTVISNLKFAIVPVSLRHCKLEYTLKTAVQTAPGWTTTATYGIEMRVESAPARTYDSNVLTFDICTLPSATTALPLGAFSSDMQAAGFAGNYIMMASRTSVPIFTNTIGNVFHQAY